MLRSKALLLSTSAVSLSLLCEPALAQAQTQAQAQAASPAGGLEEIVVTARKREESLQDVPVAVTALSEAVIQQRDITSIEKIAAVTPNLNVGRASNGSAAQITLRGVGSSSTSIGIEQSVAVIVDGAYYGQGRVIQEGFFDLERVEVLKGPQALFFGKNATAGVISLSTNDPTPEWEGRATAGYEFKAEQYQIEGVISGPLTDELGVRLAVRYSKMDGGYYDNISVNRNYTNIDVVTGGNPETLVSTPVASPMPQEEEILARLTLQWKPQDRLTATIKTTYDWNDTLNNSWNYVAFACGRADGISQLTGYPCAKDFVTHQNNFPVQLAQESLFARQNGEPYNRYKSWAVNGELEYDLDNFALSSVTNYQWNRNQWACACDFQTSDASPTWATENATWEAFSQELRLLSAFDGPFNFMIGGLYQHTTRDFEQYGYYGGVRNSAAPAGLVYAASSKISDTTGETFAIFGQLSYEITPGVEFSAGGRYTHETKKSSFSQPYVNPALTFIFRPENAADGLGFIAADQTFKDFSPEATLTWKPTDDVLLFGSFKTAYKSGGFSNGGINSAFSNDPFNDLTFNPETAEGFEGGIKATLLDNQLRANLVLFTYDYKDFQVDFFNAPIFAFQTLTADANTKGMELDIEFAPRGIPGLNITGSLNYTDAKYESFDQGPCYAGQTLAQGCNITISAIDSRQDLSGAPLSVAPEWTAAIGMFYETPVGDSFKFGLNANVRYSDAYLASGFGNPLSRQDSYTTLDAGIRFGAEDGNWQIAVIGKNLTNEFYVTGVVDGPGTGSGTGTANGIRADQLGFGTLPRTVKVELTKRF